MDGHLLLIDASGFAHRAYHVGANQFRSDGLPTWAITGFMAMVYRLLGAAQHDQPTMAAAVFDAPGRTFRHTLYPEYKRNRPARDQELAAQLPYMRHAAATLGITPLEQQGFEADDLIATLATMAAKAGIRTTIVSSDKDLLQLAVHGLVEIVDPLAHRHLTVDDVVGWKFGVKPEQVPDYQALAGDPVDNIPGVDGIGPKNAAAFIRLFQTVEGVVQGAKVAPHYFGPGVRVRLREPGMLEQLQLFRTLATLRRDVPIDTDFSDLALRPIMEDHVREFLTKLEAGARFDAMFSTAPQTQRVVAPVAPERQTEWWAEELLVAGQAVPDEPQCGFYQRRLAPGAVFVPARIWREPETDLITGEATGQQLLRCEVGNEARDAAMEWSVLSQNPITRAKFDFEMADRKWAFQYAPGDPKANPNSPIDRRALPAVHCPKPVSQKRKIR